MTTGTGGRLLGSVKITLLGTVLSGVIQAATMVVLARLLGPLDYGFYIVCLSINALSVSFFSTALERAMVIEADEGSLHGRAPIVLAFLIMVAALTIGLCAAIRTLFGWQIDVRVLGIVLFAQALAGLAMPLRALLRRRLRFHRIVGGELCGQLLGSLALASVMAKAGFGAIALATGFALSQFVAAAWVLSSAPAQMFRLRVSGMGALLRTMYGVVKVASLEAVNGQITPVAVTSVLGAASLGLFNRVYNLVTLPVQLLVSSVNRVVISGLVKVADDPDRRRDAVRLLLRVVSAIIVPLALGVAGAGRTFVAVVLGEKWMAAAPIVPLLSVAVIANMLAALLSQLAEATQRFNDKVRVQALATVLLVGALLAGGQWGLSGVAAGAMTGAILFLFLYLRLTSSIIDIPVTTLLRWLVPSMVAGLACFVAARATEIVLAAHTSIYSILTAQMVACGITAALIMLLLDRGLLLDISRLALPTALHRRVAGVLSAGVSEPLP